MMGMVRTMRAVGQEIRVLTLLMTALADAEDAATFGAGSLGKIFRLGLLAVAGGMSVATAVSVTQQGNIIPVGQTLPGQARQVRATGIAQIDRGEILFRPPAGGAIGGGGTSFQQTNYIYGNDPEQIAAAVDRKTRTRLRLLTPWLPR